jgi:hypothetical protein
MHLGECLFYTGIWPPELPVAPSFNFGLGETATRAAPSLEEREDNNAIEPLMQAGR